jgi:hypothetical protein
MSRLRIQAQGLQPGDIVGSGEVVLSVQAGTRTPSGKVEVVLGKGKHGRLALWGKYTFINIKRGEDQSG